MFDFDLIEYTTLDTERALFCDLYKVGGGTVGKMYAGELWAAHVTDTSGRVLMSTTELGIGGDADHKRAAHIAMGWATIASDNEI